MIFLQSNTILQCVFRASRDPTFQKIFWPLRANHGGPSRDTKLSETPSY